MENRPILSVIVPVYNSQESIARCLDSIVAQNFESIEIICVNDGSTDTSAELLSSYQLRYDFFKVINKSNGGLSSARNAGLEIAEGEFVSFVDSDDYISPGMFSAMISLFNDQVDMTICGTTVEYLSWSELKKSDDKYYEVIYGIDVNVTKEMFRTINVNAWNKLYRLDLINKYKIRFPVGLWYEDSSFFWCYLSVSRKISCTSIKYYNYIRNENSIMSSTLKKNIKAIDHIKNSDYVLNYLSVNNVFSKVYDEFFYFLKENFELSLKYVPSEYHQEIFERTCVQLDAYRNITRSYNLRIKTRLLSSSIYFLRLAYFFRNSKMRLRKLLWI